MCFNVSMITEYERNGWTVRVFQDAARAHLDHSFKVICRKGAKVLHRDKLTRTQAEEFVPTW